MFEVIKAKTPLSGIWEFKFMLRLQLSKLEDILFSGLNKQREHI